MTAASDGYLPQVYDELRRLAAAKLAHERIGHTLDATALVHEAWLKLGAESFTSRSSFLRAAAVAMQRVLVDHARAKKAEKRGGDGRHFEISENDRIYSTDPDTILAVNEAMERLAIEDPEVVEIARLRLFAGLSIEDAAEALGISRATAFRDWSFARAWLTTALS
ncbi:MAG: RNA polymerase subunit sigma [Planctomycetia bacterium]|nr:RNA polymerase subunit sigma [Planctomycetia bacterium]